MDADYRDDLAELFNRGSGPVTMASWSVQHASRGGTFSGKTNISVIIGPGKCYLVRLGGDGSAGSVLPATAAAGTFNMSSTAGKVALVNDNTTVTFTAPGTFSANVVDFVGYGAAASTY